MNVRITANEKERKKNKYKFKKIVESNLHLKSFPEPKGLNDFSQVLQKLKNKHKNRERSWKTAN